MGHILFPQELLNRASMVTKVVGSYPFFAAPFIRGPTVHTFDR